MVPYPGFKSGQVADDQRNQRGAAAVNRQDRSRKKAPIDESVILKVFEGYFYAPAQQGIGKKQKRQIYDVFQFIILPTAGIVFAVTNGLLQYRCKSSKNVFAQEGLHIHPILCRVFVLFVFLMTESMCE